MKTIAAFLSGVLLACVLGAAATWFFLKTSAGFSAHATPSHLEATLAAHARAAATPAATSARRNPATAAPEVLHEAMAHYADHCAVCHAENGSGDTMMGNGMYPRPPDMRLAATQGKTDGELFSIIQNGIRLSGMPAFGSNDPATEIDSWKLVAFLRHLPRLTADEQRQMEGMNPRSPDEMEEEKQEADFLNGVDSTAASPAKARPAGK